MRVAAIEIRNLRILDNIDLEFSPRVNLLVGSNGSGKSSLLEAVHIMGSGRSFRSHRLRDVVTRGKPDLRIVGRTISRDGTTETTGIEHSSDGLRIRRGGVDIRAASQLVAFLPTVAVTPDSYRLVTDGADLRRRIVDRLLFHVEPTYLDHHQRYRRALRQRNAAIRGGVDDHEVVGWDAELASSGEQLTAQRIRYLDSALPAMKEVVARLVGMPVDIRFHRGWDAELSLVQACKCLLTSDRQRGYTQAGPHRADLRFTVDGRPLQHSLSRGEMKSFVTALAVAQVRDLASILGYPPVVLVDDLASELDPDSRSRCLAELNATGAQLFLTAVPGHGLDGGDIEAGRVFHVEQGRIHQMPRGEDRGRGMAPPVHAGSFHAGEV